MSKKEKRQNLKVIQHNLVKQVFVRYPGLSLVERLKFGGSIHKTYFKKYFYIFAEIHGLKSSDFTFFKHFQQFKGKYVDILRKKTLKKQIEARNMAIGSLNEACQ